MCTTMSDLSIVQSTFLLSFVVFFSSVFCNKCEIIEEGFNKNVDYLLMTSGYHITITDLAICV